MQLAEDGLRGFSELLVDHHFLAALARQFGKRCVNHAFAFRRRTGDNRPVKLAGRFILERLGQGMGRTGRTGQQQNATCILVQSVNKLRAFLAVEFKRVKHAIDMNIGVGPALHGKAGGLVDRQHQLVIENNGITKGLQLCLGRIGLGGAGLFALLDFGRVIARTIFAPWAGSTTGHHRYRRHADFLARLHTLIGLGTFAIDADLTATQELLDLAKCEFRAVALEPAIQPDFGLVCLDLAQSDTTHCRTPLTSAIAPNNAEMPTTTEPMT